MKIPTLVLEKKTFVHTYIQNICKIERFFKGSDVLSIELPQPATKVAKLYWLIISINECLNKSVNKQISTAEPQ